MCVCVCVCVWGGGGGGGGGGVLNNGTHKNPALTKTLFRKGGSMPRRKWGHSTVLLEVEKLDIDISLQSSLISPQVTSREIA